MLKMLNITFNCCLQVLTKEELTDADRDDRDSFLDCLEDHIHDVHAHVRSHVLQIWARLCTNKCIPLARQHHLLELTGGRLQVKMGAYFFHRFHHFVLFCLLTLYLKFKTTYENQHLSSRIVL